MKTKNHHVHRHVRKGKSRNYSRVALSSDAVKLFNQIAQMIRTEMRLSSQVAVEGNIYRNDPEKISFISDTFRVTLDFKGGIAV